MIIAVDFDGTCVDHRFPDIGQDLPHAVEVLRALVARGDRLILWTMRSDGRTETQVAEHQTEKKEYLTEAVDWFKERGIELWGIQRNPEQDSWTGSPKAYAQLYIDDAALGCPLSQCQLVNMGRPGVDWRAVAKILGVPL